MITFTSAINITRPPEVVFGFLANIHLKQQAGDSPVLALDMTTSGAPRLGSKYREVVQMLPFYKGVFLSEITAFEPPQLLELTWTGPSMTGCDRYILTEIRDGTQLNHKKQLSCLGILKLMEPFIRIPLFPRLEARLATIKHCLEEG